MLKVEFLKLDLGGVVLRYYFMMMIIIGSVFAGQPLLAVLGLPIFISAILGVSIRFVKPEKVKVIKHQPATRAEAA